MNHQTSRIFLVGIALWWASPAFAADSLLGRMGGNAFTIYYLHSQPDGSTVIDEVPVTLDVRESRTGKSDVLFDGPLDNLTVRWNPDGMVVPNDAPNTNEQRTRLGLVLQGDFVVEVSGGRKVHLKPGTMLLQEDFTGFGHRMSCEAPKNSLGCVQITMDAKDPATFFKNVHAAMVDQGLAPINRAKASASSPP